MGRCAGSKPDGQRCRGIAGAGNDWCPAHDPGRQEARRRAASRAGRSRPNNELRAVKDRLLGLADDVLAGEVDRADGSSAAQILNTYLRALEIERRTHDMTDLLTRLEAVENRADRLRGA